MNITLIISGTGFIGPRGFSHTLRQAWLYATKRKAEREKAFNKEKDKIVHIEIKEIE